MNSQLETSNQPLNTELHHLAKQKIQDHAETRTFKIYHRQQAFWIKQHQIVRRRVWHWLGSIAAFLGRNPLLKPTVATGGPEALKAEAGRLRKLAALGVNVPQVVAEDEGWIMLEDIGRPLTGWIRDPAVPRDYKRKIIKNASEQLALLHSHGLWHGRPAFRDMTYDGKSLGFLDFEEDPGSTLTRAQCMVRDALLYFHSLHRYLVDDPELIEEAIETYRRLAPDTTWRNTLFFARKAWLIYTLLALLHRHLGKDANYAYLTLKTLRSYKNSTSAE